MNLEGELEDKAPAEDHAGQLYRAQSDMTMMSRVKSRGLTMATKPRLIRQDPLDPQRPPPLAFTQTWLSKESGIGLSMEDEVI